MNTLLRLSILAHTSRLLTMLLRSREARSPTGSQSSDANGRARFVERDCDEGRTGGAGGAGTLRVQGGQ
jgi:hypothetical protein